MKVAALDLGSNSFHLVVARIVADSVQLLHRVKQKVRLADGLDGNENLTDEAMQRGLATLEVIAESLKGFEPDSVRIVATHTLRRAKNANRFIKAAKAILPYPIEIISGVEEARLIYSGVAHTHHATGQQLVVDIGGGSTEFIIGSGFTPLLCRSLQMGCVSYNKRFFPQGEIKAKYFDKAITTARQELEIIEDKYTQLGWKSVVGTSGTIKTLFELCRTEDSSNEQQITLKQLKKLKEKCIAAGHVNSLPFEQISEDRRPVFCAGLAVLIAIFKALRIEQMQFSPAALREGVLYDMEEALAESDIRERTAGSLVTRYDIDTHQAQLVLTTCMALISAVAKPWAINNKRLKNMLGWAAMLHEIGLQINSRGVQRHSAYVLQNIDMPGFNQEQQDLLATLVRFHRKRIRLTELPEFEQYDRQDVIKLLCLLRLSVLLNIKRQDNFVPEISITAEHNTLTLNFPKGWLNTKPIINADLECEIAYLAECDIELVIVG
ncbi:exopolyphosphatase [Alteromonas sediminis]|uniref:Exopolyphosphatase n=1 Tax=Alteromonas sediminis TaxID=2259342 RepID=A0A3N5Y3Y3_9ALTE|nr:exopolyphosphatase [Alteromonas sediminis]RPJ68817.1 exopolyphosphatase [Alteromonas sediminis]